MNEEGWNQFESIGHRVVSYTVLFACGFVTCLISVCERC